MDLVLEVMESLSIHWLFPTINMNVLSILNQLGVTIGKWNELTSSKNFEEFSFGYMPPRDSTLMYVASQKIAKWLDVRDFFILQIDNSTSPMDDEVNIFQTLIVPCGGGFDISEQRSYFFAKSDKAMDVRGLLVLIVYFSILFSWHVHLISDASSNGSRIAIQDGVIYFIGDGEAIEKSKELISKKKKNPLSI